MVGQRQFTNKQLTTLRTLVADSNVEQMSDAVRTAVARSAAAHEELRVGSPVDRRRPVLRHRGGRLLHQDHPYRPRPPQRRRHLRHHRARTAAAGLRGTLQLHRVRLARARPGRGGPPARHPDRVGLRPRRGPRHTAASGPAGLPAGRAQPTSSPASTTRSPSRRSSRSTRYAGSCRTCSRVRTPTSAGRSPGSPRRTRGSAR